MDRCSPTRVASRASLPPFPHCFLTKQLLRARHVAARPLPYAAVHAMRCPAAVNLPKWSKAPPAVRWLAFSYLQRGVSHIFLCCLFRFEESKGVAVDALSGRTRDAERVPPGTLH